LAFSLWPKMWGINGADGGIAWRDEKLTWHNRRRTSSIDISTRKEVARWMVCREKIRLVEEYSAAALAVFFAVSKLRTKIGAEFQDSLRDSESARNKCAKARSALRNHLAGHGC
jgi:hypothetical protein